ncbi:MAG: alpha-L-fucosidase [Armatimonadota bacterium]
MFISTTSAGVLAGIGHGAPGEPGPVVTPLAKQIAWQDFELGIIYHFDSHVFMPGGHHHERSRRELVDPALYTPTKLDTDQWLEAARAVGARYAVFTATHHQGFLQWQSDIYPYGVKHVGWRGGRADLVADFVESCRRVGIAPALYVGLRFNAYRQVYGYRVNGGRGGTPEEQATYLRICERMVEELCSRYGDLAEVWFDGGVPTPEQGGPDVLPIVQKHQPNALFYHSPALAHHRWAGSESGTTGYPCWSTMPSYEWQSQGHKGGRARRSLRHGDPDGKVWCPAMADAPLREHDWAWVPNSEHKLQTVERLVNMYYQSVGRNANLILGAAVNREGLLDEADLARCAEFGAEIRRRLPKPLAETSGRGRTLRLRLRRPARIDHVLVMEDLRFGERVRKYVVEGSAPGGKWQALCDGSSIGHKRIQPVGPIEVAAVRLRCLESVARPVFRSLAVC